MAIVCPTVTAYTAQQYQEQVERLLPFAKRIHLDITDGDFAPSRTIDLKDVWWPQDIQVDLHLMLRRPFDRLDEVLRLRPQPRLVIVHAEADGSFNNFAAALHKRGLLVGAALLQGTPVSRLQPALELIDHVLVFSGNLGHVGGQADLALLDKVRLLRSLKPPLEIGWDGGVSDQNAPLLAAGGVDVLDVGGFLRHNPQPAAAYNQLVTAVQNS